MAACLLLASCGARAPESPKPGTPGFFWLAAHASFKEADFEGAHRNLDQLTLSENPHREEASVWLMVLSAGLARGAMDWADVLDEGARASGRHRGEFQRQAAAARKSADQHAMHLAELARARRARPPARKVLAAFTFPAIESGLPPGLGPLRNGVPPPAAGMEALRQAVEKRGVALSLCRLAGTGSDSARARAFLTGDVTLATTAFEWYLAQELDGIALLYSPDKLDQRARASLILTEASKALAAAGDAAEVRKLASEVGEKMRKARQ